MAYGRAYDRRSELDAGREGLLSVTCYLEANGKRLATAQRPSFHCRRANRHDHSLSCSENEGFPLLLTTPTILVVFVAIMWFGYSEAGSMVAVMAVVTPYVAVNMSEGAKQIRDRHGADIRGPPLSAVAQHLRPAADALYFLRLPLCVGQTWKIVALAETFDLKFGIGYMFCFWFQQFNISQTLAWIMMFVLLMLALEYGIFARLEARVFAWRNTSLAQRPV